MDGTLQTSSLCELSVAKRRGLIKDDHNQIAIDVLHDTYDTENPYPLVLGIQYEGSKSLFNPLLIFLDFIFTRVIIQNN